MKLSKFKSSDLFKQIEAVIPKPVICDTVLDDAHQVGDVVYFARVIDNQFCDSSSEDAMQLTTFAKREADLAVYISPRNRSIFHSRLDDVVALFKEGYKVYPVEEYEHSATAVRLAGKRIRSAKAILTGAFRAGHQVTCRWDSSYAFYAQPKEWGSPSDAFFGEFSNWINGYSYSWELLIARKTAAGEYVVTVVESDYSGSEYFSHESAAADALCSLESHVKHLDSLKSTV